MNTTDTNAGSTERSGQDFKLFNLHPSVLKAIEQSGYTTPTPIQVKAIPVAMQGLDVMGAAQTGTGKTAAFVLPILHRLMPYATHSVSPALHPVRALILTPTRELADQVAQSVQQYCQFTPLRSAVVFGGVDMQKQVEILQQGCEVLVATPGRLLDHLKQRTVNLSQVSVLVLDEADRMLDMGFLPDLARIMQALPDKRQGLLFSATFSPEIRRLSRQFLNRPVEIEVAERNTAAETVTQRLFTLRQNDKQDALVQLLREKQWSQVIVFSNTRAGANRLTRQLNRQGVSAEAIHGDKSQQERMRILDEFKQEKTPVLVATDVAARGLDIAGVAAVVNFELPYQAEDYVHRIGRTGRAGATGEAYSLVDLKQEQRQLEEIESLIGFQIEREAAPIRPAAARPARQPRKGEDPIFSQPYEPSQSDSAAERDQSKATKEQQDTSERSSVGVLLGGRPSRRSSR